MHLIRPESSWIIPVLVVVSNGRYIGSDAEMNPYLEARASWHASFKGAQRTLYRRLPLLSSSLSSSSLLYTYYPFSDRVLTHRQIVTCQVHEVLYPLFPSLVFEMPSPRLYKLFENRDFVVYTSYCANN